MGSNASRAQIGPTIGKVKNIHLGQNDLINATACPAGMGSGTTISTIAFMFEMDESVKQSAEVKFNLTNSNSGVIAGAWLRFPCAV